MFTIPAETYWQTHFLIPILEKGPYKMWCPFLYYLKPPLCDIYIPEQQQHYKVYRYLEKLPPQSIYVNLPILRQDRPGKIGGLSLYLGRESSHFMRVGQYNFKGAHSKVGMGVLTPLKHSCYWDYSRSPWGWNSPTGALGEIDLQAPAAYLLLFATSLPQHQWHFYLSNPSDFDYLSGYFRLLELQLNYKSVHFHLPLHPGKDLTGLPQNWYSLEDPPQVHLYTRIPLGKADESWQKVEKSQRFLLNKGGSYHYYLIEEDSTLKKTFTIDTLPSDPEGEFQVKIVKLGEF